MSLFFRRPYFNFFLLVTCLFFVQCNESSSSKAPQENIILGTPFEGEENLKIMSYNFHNLFDSEHDEDANLRRGKKDYTFLPANHPLKEHCSEMRVRHYVEECENTNWTPEHVTLKIQQLVSIVRESSPTALPDILAVQEIENNRVAQSFADAIGYEHFLITNSPDKRGIDVALFYKTEKIQLHSSEEILLRGAGFDRSPTRNILKASFHIGNDSRHLLEVYVNHWPSQAAPNFKRMAAAEQLRAAMDRSYQSNRNRNVYSIALGDFNVLNSEIPNAIHNVMHDPQWTHSLLDAQELYRKSRLSSSVKKSMPNGTYWYRTLNTWNKLDRILIGKNLYDKEGIEIIPTSFKISAPHFATREHIIEDENSFYNGSVLPKVPLRSNYQTLNTHEAGYSDHLPISVEIKI